MSVMEYLPLPELKEISNYLALSTDSPSGLVWIKSPARCIKPGQYAGSLTKLGYWDIGFKNTVYKAHRIVFLLQYNEDPGGTTIDHINGKDSPLVLRKANYSQNIHNRQKVHKGTTSKYKGVYWCKQKNKWKARIYVNKKQIWLGYFNSEYEAASAYNAAAIKYLGDFAFLNVVTEC